MALLDLTLSPQCARWLKRHTCEEIRLSATTFSGVVSRTWFHCQRLALNKSRAFGHGGASERYLHQASQSVGLVCRPGLGVQFSHRDEYVAKRIAFRGCHLCDLGLETYVRRIVERLVSAIGHDGDQQRRSHWLPALFPSVAITTSWESSFIGTVYFFDPPRMGHQNTLPIPNISRSRKAQK